MNFYCFCPVKIHTPVAGHLTHQRKTYSHNRKIPFIMYRDKLNSLNNILLKLRIDKERRKTKSYIKPLKLNTCFIYHRSLRCFINTDNRSCITLIFMDHFANARPVRQPQRSFLNYCSESIHSLVHTQRDPRGELLPKML